MITNNSNIGLSLAVWLADDNYDHITDENHISATTLLKPIRSIVLARQNRELEKIVDVAALVPAQMGTALHTAIEISWLQGDKTLELLSQLGHPKKVVDRVLVNPAKEQLKDDTIAIYMERRSSKIVHDFTVSGKFDFVAEGALEDFKSTGTYGYIHGSNTEKHMQQGSIYRWLNPDIITEDYITIQYIFTDWSSAKAKQDKSYPQSRLIPQKIQLMSLAATESFVSTIISNIKDLEHKPQEELPFCTQEELWQAPDTFKYYKDPSKKTRSTKNFTNYGEAYERLLKDGSVGEVVTFKGQVKRCGYCDVVDLCDQAKQLISAGSLVL